MRATNGRRALVWAAISAFALLVVEGSASAQDATAVAPPPGTWAAQLDALGQWLDQRDRAAGCASHCYLLRTLRLTGSVEQRTLQFELEGGVLADGEVAVPLFGPPDQVLLEQVTDQTGAAQVTFEGDRYHLVTKAREFRLRGTIRLQGDLALVIPGPLNTLEAELSDGRVVEGSRLSGLVDATIHLDGGQAQEVAEPTVFQLARAIRVGREVTFEYRLTMQSGTDLGVVRLPLPYGERVLEVVGSTGWRVEGSEVVLPTAGRSAEVTVTGTMPRVGTFAPDERSSYEWWLLESDAEHRIRVAEGAARQVASEESPIPRTQSTARLYMVRRGQSLEVSVESLAAAAVLAAVVESHRANVVLTRNGDLIADETLRYENNGVDYLVYEPPGRPTYLATDAEAERVMLKREDSREIMVPLRVGSHSVRVQSRSKGGLHWLGGLLEVPTGDYPLTVSSAGVTVGFPEGVYPIATFGGDEPELEFGLGDLFAILLALFLALVLVKGQGRKALATLSLAGLWLVSPTIYVLVVAAAVLGGLITLARRFWTGSARIVAVVGVCLACGVLALVVGGIFLGRSAADAPLAAGIVGDEQPMLLERAQAEAEATRYRGGPTGSASDLPAQDATGNWMAQSAVGGVVQGVTPVAIPLPSSAHDTYVRRQLVDPARPFEPAVLYVTDWTLAPLVLAWLGCLIGLGFAYRGEARRLRDAIRERIARTQAEAEVAKAPPAAPAQEPLPADDGSDAKKRL